MIIILFSSQKNYSQNSNKYLIKNLDSNKPYPDLGVAFFDDDFIIYSAQINNSKIKHSRSSRIREKKEIKLLPQNLDFYFSAIDNEGNIINNQKLNSIINSKYDDKSLVFTSDSRIVYFSRESLIADSNKKHLELFKADVISPGSWVNIKKLSINEPIFSVSHPCLSEDDKNLYFVSNKEGDFNIYKATIKDDGNLDVPKKLSTKVNTSYDEKTPFIFNNILYFSSNKLGGLGNLDIYSIDLSDNKAIAQRLKGSVNSKYNDYYYVLKNKNQGFFVSNRPGGKGKDDVYSFKIDKTPSDKETVKINKELVSKDKMISKSDTNKIKLKQKDSGNNKTYTNNDSINGTIVKTVKNQSIYDFQRRDSYYQESENQQTTENGKIVKDEYSKCQMEFDKLNNIYFDYSEFYIKADAAIELDKVIRVMRLCPKITVIASSHTDSRASRKYNITLSQQRSTSVINYILKNGNFTPDRIVGVGYGEERLLNECSDGVKCTELKHQINRRTHFEIFNY